MAILEKRPITPSLRFRVEHKNEEVANKRPERSLTTSISKTGGRNNQGRITSRRRGGGHKRLYRIIDFRRNKFDVPAVVEAIEYDPNRTSNIALIKYEDGEKAYIPAPEGLKAGDTIVSSQKKIDFNVGNRMPLSVIPPTSKIHCVELVPNSKASICRSAGVSAQLVAIDQGKATLRMPSGELRMVLENCQATLGEVGNGEHSKEKIGKAGRNRWKGRRPRVRGVAMNPVDHPMGGGEGKTSGGGHPMSPWGQLSKGFPTRKKSKSTNKLILVRRNGRKVKKS